MSLLHFLTFSIHSDRDNGLDNGRLCLRSVGDTDAECRTLNVWVATSSLANKQTAEQAHELYGMIPPDYRLNPNRAYQVGLNPYDSRNVKGVEGSFYPIFPVEVLTDKGGRRSAFGIHRDANTPGSLGCVVMSGERFVTFEASMKALVAQGITRLPLFVTIT